MESRAAQNDNFFGQTTKQLIRQQWIKKQLKECKYQYTTPRQYNLFCGTWNVNGRAKVDEEGLSDWLFPKGNDEQDIFVIGFQEIVELTPVNVAVDPMGPQRTQFWLDQINECFNKETNIKYVNICTKSLVGILLCIYVRESLVPFVSDLRWSTTAVGIMGVMGNKGGVIIRFNLQSTSLCFICAHLAASRNSIEARNNDYRNIMERTLLLPLSDEYISSNDSLTLLEKCTITNEGTSYTIAEHDLIFWIGDFNYRIDVSLSLEDIMELLQKENLLALRKKDQLNIERALGNVFQGFEEAVLTFPPTYKFQPGTDVYETRPEKKLRPPAWCDRILWRDRNATETKLKATSGTTMALAAATTGSSDEMVSEYKEASPPSPSASPSSSSSSSSSVIIPSAIRNKNYLVSKLKPSDHKPVSGSFAIETRVIDPEREKSEYLRLVRQLDRMENEIQPKVEVGPLLDLKYNSVRFQERKYCVFLITNIGSADSLVNWRFVPKGDDVQLAEPWIHVEPSLGMISPGESIRVTVEVFIDYRSLDLISKKLGETDFIIHHKQQSDQSQMTPLIEGEENSTSPSDLKRTNSDEEDKGLITPELLTTSGRGSLARQETSLAEDLEEDEQHPIVSTPSEAVTTIHLEDVLILKIENGRDYFLTVSAEFSPTAEDINLMQLQKSQIEAISAMEEMRHHSDTRPAVEPSHNERDQSRNSRSGSTGINKFFLDVKQSETTEKIIHESKNLAHKIGSQFKNVADRAAAAASKLTDQNDNQSGAKKGIHSIFPRRGSRSESQDADK